MSKKIRNCLHCFWFLKQDVGYSNWTVEDTLYFCLKKVNPHQGASCPCFNEEESPFTKHGEYCSVFLRGEPIQLDVEGDAEDELDDIRKDMLKSVL